MMSLHFFGVSSTLPARKRQHPPVTYRYSTSTVLVRVTLFIRGGLEFVTVPKSQVAYKICPEGIEKKSVMVIIIKH